MKTRNNLMISIVASVSMNVLIWLFRDVLGDKVPLFLLNIMSLLKIPGNILTLIIIAIVSPQKGWQVIHETSPFAYIIYPINSIFYCILIYSLIVLLSKYNKIRHS